VKADVVVGAQWGDEGKGKVVDFLATQYEHFVRFNGGPNAGHTVVVGEKRFTFHHVPSAALSGKSLYVGPGVVINPQILREEVEGIRGLVGSLRLTVDYRASLITPAEVELDKRIEVMKAQSAVGTTLRGIGPAYSSRALRISPRVVDVLRKDFDFSIYEALYGIKLDWKRWLDDSRDVLGGLAGDVRNELKDALDRGESVLFEAAQGTLLDLVFGTYPYVTSSGTTAPHAFSSTGLSYKYAGKVLGVVKAYITRVGSGPMPTELKGNIADYIREKGNEYGSTTGRPRRVGWLDIPLLRYAKEINGMDELFLTKLDVLAGLNELKVAVAYMMDGSERKSVPADADLSLVEPVYQNVVPIPKLSPGDIWKIVKEGWKCAPKEMKDYVKLIEELAGVPVTYVSLGPQREMTVRVA
jgi:adenylosuccinate synthase